MKRWPTKRVEEVCNLVRGSSPRPKSDPRFYGGPIPRLTIADITRDGWLVTPRLDSLTELGATMSRPVKAGTIVMAVSGNVGLCAELAVDACVHDGFVAFKDLRKDLFTPAFFGLAMSQMGETHERNKAGAIFQNITTNDVKAMSIPMPPLAEQSRIVNILNEADELKKLRDRADNRTTELLPALFNEMFGDPIANTKHWPQDLFANVGKLDRGRSKNRPRDEPSLYGGKYPFIQTGDVANANGLITSHTQTYSERGLAQSRMWPSQTLVITIAANIGKTAILTFPACFPDSMVGFIPGDKVLVDYVRQWLVTMENRLEEAAPQMAQKNINLKMLSELTIPVPPLPLQTEFAKRVTEIRELEAKQAASRQRLESLFQSMLHRAFNGEL